MKFRTLAIYLGAILVTVALLFGVRAVQQNLDGKIARHHLRYAGNIKNAPPLVVVTTVALGSFRGIIADLLWLRAQSLQQKHQYYEMVQLAQWITDLQPGFAGATCFLAWNMAYNISVTCSSPIDRWRWVNEGLKLLKNKALEYNPDDPAIYKEIAWIYAHKLGNVMDDANEYYKNRLAVEMQNVFGQFPDWKLMAESPVGREEFLRQHPADDPLWRGLPGGDPDEKYDRLYAAFRRATATPTPPEPPPELAHIDVKVLNYLRAELLRDEYKLDAKKIYAINEEYGELDWRTPEAQAIYWARESIAVGLRNGAEREINTDRIVNNALYQSFVAGKIMKTDPNLDKWSGIMYISFPNLSLVDAVYRIYTDSQTYHDGQNEFNSSFRTARINFLKEAIYTLYAYGAYSKADEYFKLLSADEVQKRLVDGKEVVFRDLEEFVKFEWVDTIKNGNAKQALTFLQGLIYSCIIYEINGDHDRALKYERGARYVYDYYVKTIGTNPRMQIPPYDYIKLNIQELCLEALPPDQVRRLRSIILDEQAAREREARMLELKMRQRQTPPPGSGAPVPAPAN